MNLFIYFNQKDRYNKTKTNRMSENNTIEFVLNTNGSISDSNDNWLLYQGSSGSVNPNNFKNLILGDVCLKDSFEAKFDEQMDIEMANIKNYSTILLLCCLLFNAYVNRYNFSSKTISQGVYYLVPILLIHIFLWEIGDYHEIINHILFCIYLDLHTKSIIGYIKKSVILTLPLSFIVLINIYLKVFQD